MSEYEKSPRQPEIDWDMLEAASIGKELNMAVEDRIRTGQASVSNLDEPLDTPYGLFDRRYDYTYGCRPVQELNGEVGVIYFMAKDPSGDEITLSVGKRDDSLLFTAHLEYGDDSTMLLRKSVPESGIIPSIQAIGSNRLSDVLPPVAQVDVLANLDAYRVVAVTGYTDQMGLI